MSGEYREGPDRDVEALPWVHDPDGILVIGVDPGARNTGVVVTDGEIPILSSTLVRKDEETPFDYALRVAHIVNDVIDDYEVGVAGVEKVTMPTGFSRGGVRGASPINPGSLVMTGVVVGTVIRMLSEHDLDVVMVHPRGNGSRNLTQYHPSLKGRRPKWLAGSSQGAGRGHEQSAYDIALKAMSTHRSESQGGGQK